MIIGTGNNLTCRQVEEDVMELQARRLISQFNTVYEHL